MPAKDHLPSPLGVHTFGRKREIALGVGLLVVAGTSSR